MTARLAAVSDGDESDVVGGDIVGDLVQQLMGDQIGLWHRYRLETDLEAMMVPGHPLSRTFAPHPRFYEYYGVDGFKLHGPASELGQDQ